MRLRRLLIEQYGNFERLDLALTPEPGRINLIVAPNGAGKSVLRRAFADLLFGYDAKAPMNFRYRTGLHLQAEAITAAGEPVQFGWRHPGGRSFPDGAVPGGFAEPRGGINPHQLHHLFALDTARLRAGGEELAQGGDSLGLALLSGTGELVSAKAARADLAARRDALWTGSRMTSKPLARAARALEEARKRTRELVQLPSARAREESALDADRDRLDAARAAHAAMQAKASQIARIDRTRRRLAEHADAVAWLAAHRDAPVLASGLGAAFAAGLLDHAKAEAAHRTAQGNRDATAAEVSAIMLDRAALAHADALEGVRGALEGTKRAAGDVVGVQASHDEQMRQIRLALRELGATIAEDQAASLAPRVADAATAQALIGEHPGLLKALGDWQRRAREAQATLDALDAAAPSPPVRLEALQTLLATIRADGDPVKRLDTAEIAARSGAPAPAVLDILPLAAFERLDTARRDAADALRQREGGRDHLAAERDAWTRDLHALQQDRPLPSQADITQARAARDAGWQLIHRHFTTDGADRAQERAYAGPSLLPLVFERHLRAADALVDQRMAALAEAREAERLAGELARTAAAVDRGAAAVAEAERALAAAQEAFAERCAPLGLDRAATIGEVREALAAAAVAARARADYGALLVLQAEWAGQLQRLLPGCEALPLAAVLRAADARVKAQADARDAHLKHERDRAHAVGGLAEAKREQAAATGALHAWQARWADCLGALGRPANETPAATAAVLQCLNRLKEAAANAASDAGRIGAMRDSIARFDRAVAELATALAVTPEADRFATARRLIARHAAAQEALTLANDADKRLAGKQAALDQAAAALRAARGALDALIAACGAADADGAQRRIDAAGERTRQEGSRDAAAAALAADGEGFSIADLQAEAALLPPDQAAGAREATKGALNAAFDASNAAAEAVTTKQRALADAAAATDAHEARCAQEAAATEFSRLLDDYAVLCLAEQMLTDAVASVEAAAGSTGVSRISAAFARVTNDDYAISGEADAEGKTVLKAVERRWPDERPKALDQLSEGTRDQLYLALRIVAIEDYAVGATRLPFVADDILQTFDDARSLAALHALLALSAHTQVIVLTHHPHVAALAAGLPAGSVHEAMI